MFSVSNNWDVRAGERKDPEVVLFIIAVFKTVCFSAEEREIQAVPE